MKQQVSGSCTASVGRNIHVLFANNSSSLTLRLFAYDAMYYINSISAYNRDVEIMYNLLDFL